MVYKKEVEMKQLKNIKAFTKTELNKLIKWSSSRYNNYKKADVVNDILRVVDSGQDTEKEYTTGSYCEKGTNGMRSGSNYGMTYKLKTENVGCICYVDLTLPSGEVVSKLHMNIK
jgi:hypothetical protein